MEMDPESFGKMAKKSQNGPHLEVIQRLMHAEKEAREPVRKAEAEADDIIDSAKCEADERVRQAEESAESEAEIVSEAREESEKRTGGRGAHPKGISRLPLQRSGPAV